MNDIYYPVAHRTQDEIDALKNRYDTFDAKIIPVVMKSNGFTSVSWTKPTTWGTSHVIYIVTVKEQKDPLIFRANIGGISEAMMVVEKLISGELMKLNIPVNEIFVADISRKQFPFDYQIQKKLKGMDIEDHFHGNHKEYDNISFEIGKYVGMWGSIKINGFGRFENSLRGTKKSMYDYIIVRLDEDIRFLVNAKLFDIKKATVVRKLFDEYKEPINNGGSLDTCSS